MPASIGNVEVIASKYLIMNSLLVRYDFKMECGRIFFSLNKSPVCHTSSNAC